MAMAPALIAIVIAVFTVIGFGGGYLVSDWQNGEKIARVEGNNTVLSNANDQCAEDVANTQIAINALKEATAERERKAAEAVKEAAPKMAKHVRTITTIRAKPPVMLDMQCDAIKMEQLEYVQNRR